MNKDDLTKKELNKVSGGDDHLNDAQDPFEVEGETGHPCPKCGTMIW